MRKLQVLQGGRQSLSSERVALLAINLDGPASAAHVRDFAAREGVSIPILLASPEIAGVYNIIFRYLFDRRNDLPLPTGFLLNTDGTIVKVYQGGFAPEHIAADARSVPANQTERIAKGLPFQGILHEARFSRNDFTYGVAMFQHGYLDEAAARFQQVIAARPNDAEGYYNLGTLNLRLNRYAGAQQYLQQTVKLKPNYPEAWNNLGMLAAQQGQSDEAIRNFERSLSLRPDYATALLNLGNLYRRQRDYARANQYLARAVQLQPDDPEANYGLGMLSAQQNDLQAAAKYLRRAVELRPDYPEAWNNLGVLSVRTNDYPAAEGQFRTAIQDSPLSGDAYLNLARLYALQHRTAEAKQVLQDLLRLKPESPSARQALQALDAAP